MVLDEAGRDASDFAPLRVSKLAVDVAFRPPVSMGHFPASRF
jgi:hypothetical protein